NTPYERPLGGTQSAICYLAAELARLGHAVTVANGSLAPAESRGVRFCNYSEILEPGSLNRFDAVVAISDAIGDALRRTLRVTVPLILWSHFGADERAVSGLDGPGEGEAWTGFAFVSNWQREQYERCFSIPRQKTRVLRNAVSPVFAAAPETEPWFLTLKAPTLVYTSSPNRGLDVLLRAFPTIRMVIPDATLRIFSSMRIYQMSPEEDPFQDLYRHAGAMDGVEYVGPVGQAQLAQELSGAAALAYPSTVPESACIVALEAMAMGAAVITTRLGALPETTNGFAFMVDWRENQAELAMHYAAMTAAVLGRMRENPTAAALHRTNQLAFVRSEYLWPDRAREWAAWLSEIAGR
ncbi:MAG: glycosyltransferase family 4 protein, partial [bacterium]